MKASKWRRVTGFLLAMLMLVQTFGGALAAGMPEGHWCQAEMEAFAEQGIIAGDGSGGLRPDELITRAEFVRIVNGVFGFLRTGKASFSDVKDSDWFSADVAAAARVGYMAGYPDGTARPTANITRQEAARIVMTVLDEDRKGSNSLFTDSAQAGSWARDSIEAAGELGVISGYPDGSFQPERNISRAETVMMLSRAVSGIYIKTGVYSENTRGSVVVGAGDVTLRDMVIEGSLYVTEGCAGTLTLDNVTVKGRIIVTGGSGRTVQLADSDIYSIDVKADADNTKIIVQDGTEVDSIAVNAPVDIEVQKGGRVESIANGAGGTKIHGTGKVDEIKANEQTTVAGKAVKPGTTTSLNASSGGSGSSGGGGGGGSTEPSVKYEMTASLNKASYDINESIVVTGSVTADGKAAANVPLTYTITAVEENKRAAADQVFTGEDGTFTITFAMPEGSQAGEYLLKLHAGRPAQLDKELSFTVTGLVQVDRSALKAEIDRAKALLEHASEYTSSSWSAFEAALAEAESTYADGEATQAVVNGAKDSLAAAITGLTRKADKTALAAAIEEAGKLDESAYTAASFSRVKEALAYAEEVMENGDASKTVVDKAAKELRDAIAALEEKGSVDAALKLNGAAAPERYRALLAEGKIFPNNGDSLLWVTEGSAAGDPVVTVVSSDPTVLAVTQDQTDLKNFAVAGTLARTGTTVLTFTTEWDGTSKTAEMAVVVVNAATVESLARAVAEGKALNSEDYKAEGWTAFAAALDTAEGKLNDVTASEEELVAALAGLKEKKDALVNKNQSDIEVWFTEANKSERLTEFTLYQDYQKNMTLHTGTSGSDIKEFVFEGDPAGGFDIQDAWTSDQAHKNISLRVTNLGSFDLKATVKFNDGTFSTAVLKCITVPQVDNKALKAALDAGKQLVSDQYTAETWAPFAGALAAADTVYKQSTSATVTQKELDDALAALNQAMSALEAKPIDKTNLQVIWYQGSTSSTDEVPETVRASLGSSLPAGGSYWLTVTGLQKGQIQSVEVLFDESYITRGTSTEGSSDSNPYVYRWRFWCKVKAEGTSRITGKVTLIDGTVIEKSFTITTEPEVVPVDKSELTALIAAVDALNEADYTPASWEKLTAAKTAAQTVVDDGAATAEDVANALAALSKAKDELAEAEPVDKSGLAALVAGADALNEKDYSASTWRSLTTARTAAQAVLDNAAATADEVAAALTDLQSAMDKLAGRVTQTAFSKKLADAEKRTSAAYTEESWNAFQTALTAAQATFKDDAAGIPAVNQAYDALVAAMNGLMWKDDVVFRTFQTAPDLAYSANYISDSDYDSSAWESEMKAGSEGATHFRALLGGHGTDVGPLAQDYAMFFGDIKLSKAEIEAALLAQDEMLVFETYTEIAGTNVVSRYVTYLPVNDGRDRTGLHSAVEAAKALKSDAEKWASIQSALTEARTVYRDPAAAQESIDAAAQELNDAVAALNQGGGEVDPPVGDIRDIGLTYGYGMFMINQDPGEYADAYFQVVAGQYATRLDDAYLYGACDWMESGMATPDWQIADAMIEYIETNCARDGKYVVTIKLYEDYETETPLTENGQPVEFQVWLVM